MWSGRGSTPPSDFLHFKSSEKAFIHQTPSLAEEELGIRPYFRLVRGREVQHSASYGERALSAKVGLFDL